MKISGTVLLLAALVFARPAVSAEKGLDIQIVDNWISIRADSVPLGRLITLLDRAMGTTSTIPPDLASRIVTVRVSNLGFDAAIRRVFEGLGLDYVVIRNREILVTNASQGPICDEANASSTCTIAVGESVAADADHPDQFSQPTFHAADHFAHADGSVALPPEQRDANLPGMQPNPNNRPVPESQTSTSANTTISTGTNSFTPPSAKAEAILQEFQPKPLQVKSIQAALDDGTVLLYYTVTPEKVVLSAVRSNAERGDDSGVRDFSIDLTKDILQTKIAVFRQHIQDRKTTRETFVPEARELYDALVRPAQEWIDKSDRVLIRPDGPLNTLPFAALIGNNEQYFVEQKPLHILTSSLYAQLKKTRHEMIIQPRLTAFGDPVYPEIESLKRAPAELKTIALGFGQDATLYIGNEATEERFRTLGRDVQYIHFATPVLPDQRTPLNSALALTKSDRDDGRLEAWEILNRELTDVDLVILSHSETSATKDTGAAGLLALTRAFHSAGVRSVLASLWSVDDDSTAKLMQAFYKSLGDVPKDEALRAVQLNAINEFVHPFYWSAFVLGGDWK